MGVTAVEHALVKDPDFREPVTVVKIKGTAQLPDGAEVMARVTEPIYGRPFLSRRAKIKDGAFEAVCGPYQRPLFPGTYKILIVFAPMRQHPKLAPKLQGMTPGVAEHVWTFQRDKVQTANDAVSARTSELLARLDKLAVQMRGWIPQLRAAKQAKELPLDEGKERAAKMRPLNLWSIEYDKVREALDEHFEQYLWMPGQRTSRRSNEVINLLMDMQEEYRATVTGRNADFVISHRIALLDRVRFATANRLQFEVIASTGSVAALKAAVHQQVKTIAAIDGAAPDKAKLVEQLGPGEGRSLAAADAAFLALYERMAAWRQQATLIQQELAECPTPASYRGYANQWLFDFRVRRFEDDEDPRLAVSPEAQRVLDRVSLAVLVRWAEARPETQLGEAKPAGDSLDALLAAAVNAGLLDVHQRAVRHQWRQVDALATELVKQTRAGAVEGREGQRVLRDWEDFAVDWGSRALRLMGAELAGLGPLAEDEERLGRFAAARGEIITALVLIQQRRDTLERALLAREQDRKQALAQLEPLTRIAEQARAAVKK